MIIMANTVLVQTQCTAMNVDAYNRTGVATVDVPNGTPLVCGVVSDDPKQKHVFKVTPAAGVQKGLWMAYSPEVVTTQSAQNTALQYKGTDVDPRDFTNVANVPFDIFYVQPNVDLIQVTAPFFKAGNDPETISGATYVEIQSDGTFAAKTSATVGFGGTQFRIISKEPIVIASGQLGGEHVDAWILECTIN